MLAPWTLLSGYRVLWTSQCLGHYCFVVVKWTLPAQQNIIAKQTVACKEMPNDREVYTDKTTFLYWDIPFFHSEFCGMYVHISFYKTLWISTMFCWTVVQRCGGYGWRHFIMHLISMGMPIMNIRQLIRICGWSNNLLFPLNPIRWRLFLHMGRSRRCDCLVTWFCYHLIAKPGDKTVTAP